MKRTFYILTVIALLWACNSRHEEAARTVCNKVSSCCKALNGVKAMAGVSLETENTLAEDEVSSFSLMENPTQILIW